MSTGEANVVQVVESGAELGADERVGRGVEFSSDAVGLEAEDSGQHEVYVVSPAGYDRVAVDSGGGDPGSGEGLAVRLPDGGEALMGLLADAGLLSDEGVLADHLGVPAVGGAAPKTPVVVTGDGAEAALEAHTPQKFGGVVGIWVCLELGADQLLNFFGSQSLDGLSFSKFIVELICHL